MQEHNVLHPLQGIVAESLTEHTSLASMYGLIDSIMRVIDPFDGWECTVELGLLYLPAMAVDVMETGYGVDRDEIRCTADVGAVLLVKRV